MINEKSGWIWCEMGRKVKLDGFGVLCVSCLLVLLISQKEVATFDAFVCCSWSLFPFFVFVAC